MTSANDADAVAGELRAMAHDHCGAGAGGGTRLVGDGADPRAVDRLVAAIRARWGVSVAALTLRQETVQALAARLAAADPGGRDDRLLALMRAQLDTMRQVFAEQRAALAAGGAGSGAFDALAALHRAAERQVAPAPADALPLTDGQRELWMVHQLGGAAALAFNETLILRLSGPLDPAVLHSAWEAILDRHDALTLTFARDGGSMRVGGPRAPLARVDLAARDDPGAALEALARQSAAQPFDLSAGPPVRPCLARLAEEDHALVLSVHHAVCDGWSFDVILSELATLYSAGKAGERPDLPAAPSFAAHARTRDGQGPDDETLRYWNGVLTPAPDLPDLPADRPRGAMRGFRADSLRVTLDAAAADKAAASAAAAGCTRFGAFCAALQILVWRLTGSRDAVLGVPVAGQPLSGAAGLVGHAVRFLPLHAPLEPGERVTDHLARVGRAQSGLLAHAGSTLGALLPGLDVPRHPGRLPLTEILITHEKMPAALHFGAATGRIATGPKAGLAQDLQFALAEAGDELILDIHYAADLFDAATVRAWADMFARILAEIGRDPARRPGDLPILSDGAETALLAMSTEGAPEPAMRPLLHSVAAQAKHRPQAVALRDARATVTYGELWRRVEALAAHLQAVRPDGAGPYVAVAVSRGVRLPEALLAVLHAGLAYLPLDPDAPPARLAEMAGRAGARIAIADGPLDWAAPGTVVLPPDDAPAGGSPAAHGADDTAPAYVIFTSGSTGEPKGVEVPRGALDNFLSSMAVAPGLGQADRLLAVTTVAFDIAALELLLPLTVGAEVFVAGRDEVRDGFRLAARLNEGRATVMQATPTLWQMLLEAGFRPRADLTMLAGGEPLPRDLAHRLMAGGGALWNMYGPTETTIWSSCGRLDPDRPVTLGRPVRATELHVLDENGAQCPPGVPGELNIGGAGLALGYLHRPDLTEGAFRPVALGGRSRRLYRTGDRAVRGADGALLPLGRLDRQIKLRGYRIEPGEIEARLRALPDIAQAAVELRSVAGGPVLTGYVVPRGGDGPDPARLAAALRRDLPDYMVPGRWVVLAALPLTPNGKLDRRALPDPVPGDAPPPASAAPVSPGAGSAAGTEARVSAIAAEVLGRAEVPPDVPLLALGADSLTLFRLAARLLSEGLEVEVRDMLAQPTIRALAALAESRARGRDGTEGEMPAQKPARPALRDFRHGARRDAS